jgi:hypothetical protein
VTYAKGGAGEEGNIAGTDGLGNGGDQALDGGDGIVIIRYNPEDFVHAFTGGTITEVGGDVVHTFTSDDTFKPVLSGTGFFNF